MTELATLARSIVVEREMPHPPEKIRRALTQGPLIGEWLMQNDLQPVVGHHFNLRSKPMPHWNGVVDCEVLIVLHVLAALYHQFLVRDGLPRRMWFGRRRSARSVSRQ